MQHIKYFNPNFIHFFKYFFTNFPVFHDLRDIGQTILSPDEFLALSADLKSSSELIKFAAGDWRILLTGACTPTEEQLKHFYSLKDASIEPDVFIQRSLWGQITDESDPISEIAWALANDQGQLSINTILKIFELQKPIELKSEAETPNVFI